jgi:hypothetical protein
VGPFTAIADRCAVDGSEIEYSIVMARAYLTTAKLIVWRSDSRNESTL